MENKISKSDFNKINSWIYLNKDIIKNLYSIFLFVCNDKYDLELMNSKQLYLDFSIYL